MKRLLHLAAGVRSTRWPIPRRLSIALALAVLCAPLALIGGRAVASAMSRSVLAQPSPARHAVAVPQKSVPLVAAASGCDTAAPAPPSTSIEEQMRVGDVLRSYLLHVPLGYRSTHPTPLMLSLHGHDSTARIQERMTGFSVLANRQGFLVVYPQGAVGQDHATGWATGPRTYPHVDDVAFVRDLLAHLRATLCVDPHRIYASGFSNGGGMAALLACRLPDQIAAFAAVSGSYFSVAGGCHPGRAVPILEIHGTADHTVPYDGNAQRQLPPVTTWLAQWAARDGCASEPEPYLRSLDIVGEQWPDCKAGGAVVHYALIGGKHVWPTTLLAPVSDRHVSTATLIWAFCQAHPLV